MLRSTLALIALVFVAPFQMASAQEPSQPAYLYKTSLVQAAPGKLLDLIDICKRLFSEETKVAGEATPLWMRHNQGDRWDLLILYPMGSYSDYYKPDRVIKRDTVLDPWRDRLKSDIAWQEDVFVYGPPLEDVRKAFAVSGLFHVEMFESLPGKQAELKKQREMENAFSRVVKAPENFIFLRDQGAAWDLFTIGCFENLKHYAQAADVPPAEVDAAAKSAGFESTAQIGPYLRTLIALHHDTLAVAIK
jgi:hypothetical protein